MSSCRLAQNVSPGITQTQRNIAPYNIGYSISRHFVSRVEFFDNLFMFIQNNIILHILFFFFVIPVSTNSTEGVE